MALKNAVIPLFVFLVSAAGAFPAAASAADADKLPLAMSVTEVPFENQPDYFGGGRGNPYYWIDFPVCPVEMDGEFWVIFKSGDGPTVFRWKGTNLEDGVRQPDGIARIPVNRPYFLGGMWYDGDEKKLYAPMHCEFYDGEGAPERQIHLASSLDKGLTWRYEGPIVTRDDPAGPARKPSEFSGRYWDGGVGDFLLCVDGRGGYIYLYSAAYVWPKGGTQDERGFQRHQVARCAISDKMKPGKWRKFYKGRWDEPGLGGRASYVNAYYVMYNSFLGKYLGMNYGGSLAVCADLTKQDWTPGFKIAGGYWGSNGVWAWQVTDADLKNVFAGGRTLYLYSYWDAKNTPAARKFRIDLSAGETPPAAGYAPESKFSNPIGSADPSPFYPLEPFYESADAIESRRTRRVSSANPETTYSGPWADEESAGRIKGAVKACGTKGGTVEFSFRGGDLYWRAVKGPTGGKADVFLDGELQGTADSYAERETAEQIAFMKTGLAPGAAHTMKIVVRGEGNDLSAGTAIRHLSFEYAAESWRASDGFSSIQGKNGWAYEQKDGDRFIEMVFDKASWAGNRCGFNFSQWRNEIGGERMMAVADDVARKWTAPRAGTVRLEGEIVRDGFDQSPPRVLILVNGNERWPLSSPIGSERQAYDFTVAVDAGDEIRFILKGDCDQNPVRINWDPVITYVDDFKPGPGSSASGA